jgi:hypothetical protein
MFGGVEQLFFLGRRIIMLFEMESSSWKEGSFRLKGVKINILCF